MVAAVGRPPHTCQVAAVDKAGVEGARVGPRVKVDRQLEVVGLVQSADRAVDRLPGGPEVETAEDTDPGDGGEETIGRRRVGSQVAGGRCRDLRETVAAVGAAENPLV